MLGEVLVEPHPRDHLDESAAHVGRHRIVPCRTGIEGERFGGEAPHAFFQRVVGQLKIAESVLPVHCVKVVLEEEPVGQTRRVGEHILHRHDGLRRADLRCGRGAAGEHLHLGELGNVRRHRILKQHSSLLIELHQGDRGNRLRHGINAVDRVVAEWAIRRHVSKAHRVAQRHLTPMGDLDLRASELSLSDIAIDKFRHAGKALGIESGGGHVISSDE